MGWRFTVEILAVLIMLGGVGGIFYGVFKGTIALSVRTLQFLAITFVVPAVLILSLERSLGSESTAALLGTIIGYVLAELDADGAVFTLHQRDYYTPRPAARPEDANPEWRRRAQRNDGSQWRVSFKASGDDRSRRQTAD